MSKGARTVRRGNARGRRSFHGGSWEGFMHRTFANRLFCSSLVAVGAAGAVSACTNATPLVIPDPNPVHIAAKAPPPISGGTLLVTNEGLAVAADSDRDVVWL